MTTTYFLESHSSTSTRCSDLSPLSSTQECIPQRTHYGWPYPRQNGQPWRKRSSGGPRNSKSRRESQRSPTGLAQACMVPTQLKASLPTTVTPNSPTPNRRSRPRWPTFGNRRPQIRRSSSSTHSCSNICQMAQRYRVPDGATTLATTPTTTVANVRTTPAAANFGAGVSNHVRTNEVYSSATRTAPALGTTGTNATIVATATRNHSRAPVVEEIPPTCTVPLAPARLAWSYTITSRTASRMASLYIPLGRQTQHSNIPRSSSSHHSSISSSINNLLYDARGYMRCQCNSSNLQGTCSSSRACFSPARSLVWTWECSPWARPYLDLGGGPTFLRPGENAMCFNNNSLFTQNTQRLPPYAPIRPEIARKHWFPTQPIPLNAQRPHGVRTCFSQMHRHCQSNEQQRHSGNTHMPSWYTLAYPQLLVTPPLSMNQHPLSNIFKQFFHRNSSMSRMESK